MALIQANRESIDDRFSVLGFTVRTENPLFEIALAAHPDLLKGENRAKRTASNFFTSRVLGATRRGEAVYLVPPTAVARFVGQPRLYFGLATYKEGDRNNPVSVKIPDAGSMYVNTSGLTERGLRRTARNNGAVSYGNGGEGMAWGGDALVTAANGSAAAARNGNGASAAAPTAPAPYSDGYSDDLWKQDSAAAPAATNGAAPAVSTPPPAPTNGGGGEPRLVTSQAYGGTQPYAKPYAKPFLVEPYDRPSSWWDALTTQIGHFARGAMWFLGVTDTRQPPYSAICQVRRPDGTAEGAHMGTAFFIGPRLLLTAGHVVDGQSELIIVPGKNGAGTGSSAEPFGRFRVTQFRKHGSYGSNGHDNDMALICVPAANAASAPNYFSLVEELTQSRPEGVVVSGYAAWWHATSAIEEYVNANIDENRQHAHGGHIRDLTDGSFTYDLQTLAGTSGSPVYWIEDGGAPCAHLVGVHVAANDDRTNRGCRITQEKLSWIRETAAAWGQTLTFSLGTRALDDTAPPSLDEDPDAIGIGEDEPVLAEAASQALRVRSLDTPTPDYPAASRFVPAHARNFTRGRRRDRVVDRVVIHITAGGPNINGTISWFQNGDRVNERTGKAIRSSSHYIVGRDGEVVQMVRNADTAHHASSANSRSIGIEHNANKPTHSNPRDLPPTEAQYEASARLVAWLCQQYGLPADREHIRGHMEMSPGDNHDCPSSIWDWDHYMACVQVAAAALAAPTTAQGLGSGRAYAVAQEIITPFYDPADPSTALSCQNDAFSLAREEWFAGVPNTTIFPHSAICQLIMTAPNGNQYQGTGFYIGNNRILTCAHNLHGKSSVQIIPGRNSAGGLPFGQCTVNSSSWRVAPRYSGAGDWDNDLAVIDNVPIAAPNGRYFRFLNATPSDRLPVVVCGYSLQSVAVPGLTDIIDGDMQHLHGGYVREQPTPETIDYPILSLKGASGSPVYSLSGSGGNVEAKICAVHVSGEPAAHGLNRGCFITPNKIDWIEGRATSFALDVRGRAPRRSGVVQIKPASRAQGLLDLLPVDLKVRVFIPAPVAVVTVPVVGGLAPGQSGHGGDGRGFQLNGGTSRAEVTARFHFGSEGQSTRLTDLQRSFGESANYNTDDTVAVAGKPEWYRDLRPGAQPIERGTQSVTDSKLNLELGGSSFHGILSMAENAVVVTFNIHASDPIVTGAPDIDATLALLIKIDGDRVKVRVNGGHDEFPAYEVYANGTLVYSYDPIAANGTPWGLFGDGNWDVNPDSNYVDVGPASEYRIIGPVRIGTSQSVRALEIPLDPGIGGQSIGVDALSPGDIIVSTARHAVSYAIRAGTLSAISHAMIYVGGGNIVEAVGDGVREAPLANAIGDAILAVAYRDPRVDASKAQAIVDFARAQVGRPYNYGGIARIGHRILFPLQSRLLDAIRSITGTDDASARSFFCSELVFAAFEAAGIPLVAAAAGDNTPGDVVALTRGSLGYVGHLKARDEFLGIALGLTSHSLGSDNPDYAVHLIPQPDKNSCWAASMAMLYSFRRNLSLTPETLANDVGASLATSYGWDLLEAVRKRYGFEMIRQPDNTSLYHTPQQWADWLNTYGPLWVVIVGAPHAVVVAGIRGNLADPASVQVKILNPWDTRVAFDNDVVAFNPRNNGYEDWLSFNQFAADFGNMAQPDYGNWRVLHLPTRAASAQSLGAVQSGALDGGAGVAIATTIAGAVMERLASNSGDISWELDQLRGYKHPNDTPPNPMPPSHNGTVIRVTDGPHVDVGFWITDRISAGFEINWQYNGKSVGNVMISNVETNDAIAMGLTVKAKIMDDNIVYPPNNPTFAALRIRFEYRFDHVAKRDKIAIRDIHLFGDGSYTDSGERWTQD